MTPKVDGSRCKNPVDRCKMLKSRQYHKIKVRYASATSIVPTGHPALLHGQVFQSARKIHHTGQVYGLIFSDGARAMCRIVDH